MRFILLLSVFLMLSVTLWAQPTTLKVWPTKVPGSKSDPTYKEENLGTGNVRIANVTEPQLEVFLAPKEKANGTAVVICPGGGYGRLAIDHEGYDIATWLNSMGIAGIVLKYRLPSDKIMEDKTVGPLQDVQESIRIVRRNAKAWGLDAAKIGIIGFSAGGHLAATASTMYGDKVYSPADIVSARPDFSILMYGVLSMQKEFTHMGSRNNLLGTNPTPELVNKYSNELRVNAQTPPAFLVHAADDGAVPVKNSLLYFEALQKSGVPAELHIYEKGGHGFGLGKNKGAASGWPEACRLWFRERGLLGND